MIVIDETADKALMALIAELFGLLGEAFAAIVTDQCAIITVVFLTARIGMAGAFFDDLQAERAFHAMYTVALGAIRA